MLETLIRDGRYAVRMLRKTPGFTLIALATLAIGIGVNTAVFTVVNALLLEPLPYPDADRLATIEADARSPRGLSQNIMSVDGATFLALRDNATLVDVAAVGSGGWGVGVNMVAQHRAANGKQSRVSAGFFHVLGVMPFMGRELRPRRIAPAGLPSPSSATPCGCGCSRAAPTPSGSRSCSAASSIRWLA